MHYLVFVSEACQINDLDHNFDDFGNSDAVSEACQINDLDHQATRMDEAFYVSEACQINDLDHEIAVKWIKAQFQKPVRSMT